MVLYYSAYTTSYVTISLLIDISYHLSMEVYLLSTIKHATSVLQQIRPQSGRTIIIIVNILV